MLLCPKSLAKLNSSWVRPSALFPLRLHCASFHRALSTAKLLVLDFLKFFLSAAPSLDLASEPLPKRVQ